jgi:hypothetical protein
MYNQEAVNHFYATGWRSNLHLFQYSGFNLVDEISKLDPKLVIDAGCGVNGFKGKIPNVIGFDPVFSEADIKCTILTAPFRDQCADVVFALGSVNFGDHNDVALHVMKLKSWLLPGGLLFMRGAPGGYQNDQGLEWFRWGTREIVYFAELLDLELLKIEVEYNTDGVLNTREYPHRYVWLYRRPQRERVKLSVGN